MRNTRWLRYGLASASLVAGGLGAFLVACGDDDAGVVATDPDTGGGNNGDSGGKEDTGGGGGDSGGDTGTKDAGTNAKLQLVNAATDFGPGNPSGALRICYAVGKDEASAVIAPLPPLPDRKNPPAPFAGVFIGTGGAVQGTGADLSTLVIVPYIMNAASMFQRGIVKPDAGPGTSCTDILDGAKDAGGALTAGKDYWKLPAIPAGTFQKEKSYLLALTGCAGDYGGTAGKCGSDFTAGSAGNGNLKIRIYELDKATTVDATKIGTQYIHLSAAGDLALGPAMQSPGYISDPNNAGTFKGVTGDGGVEGGTGAVYAAKTPLAQVSGVTVASDSFTVNPLVADLAIPLPLIKQLSYGASVPDGGDYRNGASFTFIAIGDPGESADAGGNFNTRKFHYIALPNDPISETYKP
jgi:hypothetical protein